MGNADDGHLGPLNGVSIPATYTQELVLTRNTGANVCEIIGHQLSSFINEKDGLLSFASAVDEIIYDVQPTPRSEALTFVCAHVCLTSRSIWLCMQVMSAHSASQASALSSSSILKHNVPRNDSALTT